MPSLVEHFVRTADGGWKCTADAEFTGPLGRMQVTQGSVFMPGTTFMGVDLARWLEEQCSRQGPAPS